MVSKVGSRNNVLDGRAHWSHLANTVDQWCVVAMIGSANRSHDVACYQITLRNLVVTRASVNEQYFAICAGKPDHRAVGSDTVLLLSHSWFVIAVDRWSNVDNVAICHGTVDLAILCPVATVHRTLSTPAISTTFNLLQLLFHIN